MDVVGAGVPTPGTGMGLSIAIFMVVLSFKSIEGACGAFAPGQSLPDVFLFLI